MVQVEDLQSAISNLQSTIEGLPQAILRKAFRGQIARLEKKRKELQEGTLGGFMSFSLQKDCLISLNHRQKKYRMS